VTFTKKRHKFNFAFNIKGQQWHFLCSPNEACKKKKCFDKNKFQVISMFYFAQICSHVKRSLVHYTNKEMWNYYHDKQTKNFHFCELSHHISHLYISEACLMNENEFTQWYIYESIFYEIINSIFTESLMKWKIWT
jgi:hypothetical protein